jgi:hypothetical protein
VFWGGGAREVGDLRLLEDGGERGGALVSDIIEFETASEGQRGRGERVSVSTGADSARKRTLSGRSAPEMGDLCLLEDGSERGGALGSNPVAFKTASGEGWGEDVVREWRVNGR